MVRRFAGLTTPEQLSFRNNGVVYVVIAGWPQWSEQLQSGRQSIVGYRYCSVDLCSYT